MQQLSGHCLAYIPTYLLHPAGPSNVPAVSLAAVVAAIVLPPAAAALHLLLAPVAAAALLLNAAAAAVYEPWLVPAVCLRASGVIDSVCVRC